jgi:hypothetical protein
MQGNIVRVLEQAEFLDIKIIVKLPVEEVRLALQLALSIKHLFPENISILRA